MTRRGFIGLATGVAALLLAGCGRRVERFRYRVTVEVTTPEGLRTGSSVQELEHQGAIPWLPGGNSFRTSIHGEAVAVDLPGDTLFMLLQFDSDALINYAILYGVSTLPIPEPDIRKWPWNRVELLRSLRKAKARIVLNANPPPPYGLNSVPWVRFRDRNDPNSFEVVNPLDLPASFGPGVRLERLIFSFADEEMTRDISRHLKWMGKVTDEERMADEAAYPRALRGLRN